MKEICKIIEDFKDYQITNQGKIKSLKHNKEKFLKSVDNGLGYLFVDLCKNNIVCRLYVHRLVANAFIPNPDHKPEVNHKDGDKQNNFVNNLEWVSHSENMKHAYKTKIRKNYNGNNSPHHKLTKNNVLNIHELYLLGNSQYQISKIYNVSRSCIEHIVNGITWKELNKLKGK